MMDKFVRLAGSIAFWARWGALSAFVLACVGSRAVEFEVGGSTQVLLMGRDFGDGVDGESASASVTLEASSRVSESLRVKGQVVHVQRVYESGKEDAGYWLSNDTTSVLNELYVNWDLGRIGYEDTSVQIGRQTAGYDFFGTYKVRHKQQAFEGVVFKTKVRPGVSVDLGHIERYSTWACREDGASTVTSDFRELSERLGFEGGDSGVQFVSTNWKHGDSWDFTGYDYYADDFYNNAGLKAAYAFPVSGNSGKWTASAHYLRQDGVNGGRMSEHDASSLELNLRYRQDGLTVDAGWTHIADESNLAVPFRTSYVIDATLLWYTNQFEAGTDSLHLKSVYNTGKWTFVGVLVGAFHADDREEQELNVVVKYRFENKVWAAFKGGYGRRDFAGDLPGQEATDLRLFVGYDF